MRVIGVTPSSAKVFRHHLWIRATHAQCRLGGIPPTHHRLQAPPQCHGETWAYRGSRPTLT